jgi:acyl dehydratase
MEIYRSVADLEAAVGHEIGPTDWMTVDQARVNGFADATDDHQWIHVDGQRAATGPFGTTIAHGFLTLSLIPYLSAQLRQIENVRMAINYGLDRVRFPAVLPVGGRIRARSTLKELRPTSDGGVQLISQVTVDLEGSSKPVCVADILTRCYFASRT